MSFGFAVLTGKGSERTMLADGTEKHPNTPFQEMQENARKYVRIRAIFHRWTPGNKRFLEFTRTQTPKMQENSANTGRHDIFQKFIERWTCIGQQAFAWIHARLLLGKMQEKHKKTSENARTHDNFRSFAERWTLENMRFLEFPRIRRLGK